MDWSPPPKFELAKPAILRVGEPWERRVNADLIAKGFPLSVRQDMVRALRRVAGEKRSIVRATELDLGLYLGLGASFASHLTGGANPVWGDVVAATTLGSTSGSSTSNFRGRILGPFAKSGTKIRITVRGGTGTVADFYFGHRAPSGDNWDYAASSPAGVAVTLGGSGGFALTTSDQVSDEINFAFDGARDIIYAIKMTTGTFAYTASGSNSTWFKAAASESATPDVTGYTDFSATAKQLIVRRVEVFG